jgi:hypothetical protein
LIVIHHIKENNFFRTHPQNKAPPQIQPSFVEKSALQPPESKAGMPMWAVHQIWKRNKELDDFGPVRLREVCPRFDKTARGPYRAGLIPRI